MDSDIQRPPLISALLKPESYPHPATPCELIETHISWVILAGEFVYKIKKPLDLGFLDFSTLEKRRFFCQEELRLNSRLAPSLYLEVVAIGGEPHCPELGAQSAIFEYAVKMRRFPQEAQLDRMLERGELLPSHIDAFAALAADFHATIAVAGEEVEFGEPQQVWQPVEENFRQIREHFPDSPRQSQLASLERWSQEQFSRLKPQLLARKRNGYIRECHGDMHLRNLAWIEGQAVAFDCIEFNPVLRWIDVISEVAFLVMDLQERDRPRLAQRFLNAYLEISGDYQGLALLPFYLVYRALVRAKVAAIRCAQPQLGKTEREQATEEFVAYLVLAERYTRSQTPMLLVARGMSASGKTTLTGPLLEQLGAIRLRSDVERKRLFAMSAEEDGRAAPGEGIYTASASERTYTRLAELAGGVLDAGFPVIIDAVCLRRAQRDKFYQLAINRGLPFLLLEFEATAAELERRIISRKKGASDADVAVLRHQLSVWEPLEEDERAYALTIETGKLMDESALLEQVRKRL
jgi:aminoglycoside phosphotransferase family enzyme/predicted kinase